MVEGISNGSSEEIPEGIPGENSGKIVEKFLKEP